MTKRMAISLSDELFASIEHVRKRRHIARSVLIQQVVDEYMKAMREKELEERYFEGYRRFPDGDDPDFVAWERATIEDRAKRKDLDEWPELRTTARSGGRVRTKSAPSSSRREATHSGAAPKSRARR